ncbi:MAG TPA: DUF2017 family protein [Actinomycetota bacterium]|nr:DUF2017 family protein [Actinomycetota bacterium]
MPGFARRDDATIAARLEPEERVLLRRLAAEMRGLLLEGDETDAARARLFPRAHEDPDEERAYSELVGDELERGKLRALDRLEETLGAGDGVVTLSGEDADAWLTSLNDMRLALGTRLDVDEATMSAPLDEDDPDAHALAVLHWLGWIQESLLEVRPRLAG